MKNWIISDICGSGYEAALCSALTAGTLVKAFMARAHIRALVERLRVENLQ